MTACNMAQHYVKILHVSRMLYVITDATKSFSDIAIGETLRS